VSAAGGRQSRVDRGDAPDGEDWLVVYGSLMRGLPSCWAGATVSARVDAGLIDDLDAAGDGAAGPETASGDLLDRLGVGAGLRRVGECRVPGVLFDLGAYPALRPARDDADVVCGELHAILDRGVLAVLDAFEGFDPRDPAGSDYLRERVSLVAPRGGRAWIYVFNRDPDPATRIASGDWRGHLAKRRGSAHDPAARPR
jgi:gamma-glutamylcyclotransferase (GGCT)/AIG2-like uncharacterized protein YtfP